MDRIKRYIDCFIPTETCNLRCHYCYIAQKRKFNNKLVEFPYSIETMQKAFSQKRLGGPCLINFCAGGETLLSNQILPLARALIHEGHYISIVTNGTVSQRFDEIQSWDKEELDHLFFKISFHYLEMKRLNYMDRFFNNVEKVKACGASFTVEITPSDELIPYIDEVKNICMERLGTLCQITIARDDRTDGIDILSQHSFEEYKKIWGAFDSGLFQFKTEIYHVKRNDFCYAGDWTLYVNMSTGDINQCYCGKHLGNLYENVEEPVPLEAIGCMCSLPYCYNGHSFLALGAIPELNTPTYAQLRDRVCQDGSTWLSPAMRSFMSTKLIESNEEYPKKQRDAMYRKKKYQEQKAKLWNLRAYRFLCKCKDKILSGDKNNG